MPSTTSFLAHARHLLQYVADAGGDHHHVVADEVHIVPQKLRQRRGRAHPDDINPLRFAQRVHRAGEICLVQILYGLADVLHIRLEHRPQHRALDILPSSPRAAPPSAGYGSFPAAPFAAPDIRHTPMRWQSAPRSIPKPAPCPQLRRRHERRLVVVVDDIFRNALLSLGQPAPRLIDPRQQFLPLFHLSLPPFFFALSPRFPGSPISLLLYTTAARFASQFASSFIFLIISCTAPSFRCFLSPSAASLWLPCTRRVSAANLKHVRFGEKSIVCSFRKISHAQHRRSSKSWVGAKGELSVAAD